MSVRQYQIVRPLSTARARDSGELTKRGQVIENLSLTRFTTVGVVRRTTMGSPEQSSKRQYVNFAFYKVDPAWRRLPDDERSRGKQEFIRVLEEYSGKVMIIPYTLVGIRGDCDFMLWRISYELELSFRK